MRKFAALVAVLLLVLAVTGVSSAENAEYGRVARYTPAYLEPTEDEIYRAGYMLLESNVQIKSRYDNGWIEAEYYYDPKLSGDTDQPEGYRTIYLKEEDVLLPLGSDTDLKNAVVAESTIDTMQTGSAGFDPALLMNMGAQAVNPDDTKGLEFTVRTRAVGETANDKDIQIVQTKQPYINNNRFLYTPQIELFGIEQYPINKLAYNLPSANGKIEYTINNDYLRDGKTEAGLKFILENSYPYKVYTGYTDDYINASRTASAIAIQAFMDEVTGAGDKLDLYSGIEAYNTDSFSSDYFCYAYWLFENAVSAYSSYEEEQAVYVSCDIESEPVLTDGKYNTTVRIITNSPEGWMIEKSYLPEDVVQIGNAREDSLAYYGDQGSQIVNIVSRKSSADETIIPVRIHSNKQVVQFAEPADSNYPVLVSLALQDSKHSPKQIRIRYSQESKISLSVTNEEGAPVDGIFLLKGSNGDVVTAETEKGVAVIQCAPDIYTYNVVNLPREYNDLEPGEVNAANDADVRLVCSKKIIRAEVHVVDAASGELLNNPCEIEVYRNNTEPELISKGNPTLGVYAIDSIPAGEYFARQIGEFKGYEPAKDVKFSITYDDAVVDLKNEPITGYVEVKVVDDRTDKPIAGAVAEIVQNDTVIATVQTDEYGKAISDNVPVGECSVRLASLPNGYFIRHEEERTIRTKVKYKRTSTVKWTADSNLYTVIVYPREAVNMEVYRTKRPVMTNRCDLMKCKYQLIAGEGNPYYEAGTVVAEFAGLNKNSRNTFVNLILEGNYLIHETDPGTGYETVEDIPFEISSETNEYQIPVLKTPIARSLKIELINQEGSPIPGEVVYVYRSEYKNYKTADKQDRKTAETNEEGIAVIDNVLSGEWTVENGETKLKATIDRNSPEVIEIIPGAETEQPETVEVSDVPVYAITVCQKDMDGNEFHEKAEYYVISNTETVSTIAVDETGEPELALEPGEYVIRQKEASDNYQAAEDVPFTIRENDPPVQTITLYSKPKDKSLSVNVLSPVLGKEGTQYVPDVKLTFKDDLFARPALSVITSGNGAVITTPVEIKDYLVFVSNIPDGYELAENPVALRLKGVNENPINLSINLIPKATMITFVPFEIAPGAKNGSIYGLYAKNGQTGSDEPAGGNFALVASKSAYNGRVMYCGGFVKGDYMIAPIQDMNGTPDIESATEFSLSETGVWTTVSEKPNVKYTVTVQAKDTTTNELIPDAYARIYHEGSVVYEGYLPGGSYAVSLKPGEYTLKPVLAPEGYAMTDASAEFTVSESGTVEGSAELFYEKNVIEILVTDAQGIPVPSTDLLMTNKATERSIHAITDEKGIARFVQVGFGDHEIVECFPAPGYAPNKSVIRVHMDGLYRNAESEIVLKTEINRLYFRSLDYTGAPIQGVELTLLNSQNSLLQTVATGEDGTAAFTAVPFGKYKVKMTSAPDQYLKSKTVYDLVIGNSDNQAFARMYNFVCLPKNASFRLVDGGGNGVYGAEFALIDKNDAGIVETVKSDSDGRFEFSKYDYGEYIVRETKSPDGTAQVDDYELIVGKDHITTEAITLTTSPDYYEFMAIDNKGNPLENILFGITNVQTNEKHLVSSDVAGMVRFESLRLGNYEIQMEGVPEEYSLSPEKIRLSIDSAYIPDKNPYMFTVPAKNSK